MLSVLKNLDLQQYGYHPPLRQAEADTVPATTFMIYMILVSLIRKGTVRTKYGTKREYIQALKAIRAKGMQSIVDIVLNHKAGGDEIEKIKVVKVNPDNRNEAISEPFEIEAFTKFNFPGRKKKYSSFIWDYMCFTGVDYAL